jgi:hypothetical protein
MNQPDPLVWDTPWWRPADNPRANDSLVLSPPACGQRGQILANYFTFAPETGDLFYRCGQTWFDESGQPGPCVNPDAIGADGAWLCSDLNWAVVHRTGGQVELTPRPSISGPARVRARPEGGFWIAGKTSETATERVRWAVGVDGVASLEGVYAASRHHRDGLFSNPDTEALDGARNLYRLMSGMGGVAIVRSRADFSGADVVLEQDTSACTPNLVQRLRNADRNPG